MILINYLVVLLDHVLDNLGVRYECQQNNFPEIDEFAQFTQSLKVVMIAACKLIFSFNIFFKNATDRYACIVYQL